MLDFFGFLSNWRLGSVAEILPLPPSRGPQRVPCRTVLVVEYRDEVFARLATDLTEAGLRVERAVDVTDAAQAYLRDPAELLAVNVDLPDETGWLVAAKLRLLSASPVIWLYASWPSSDAMAMAEYVGADRLIGYEADLGRLSAAILSQMSILPMQCAAG